MEYLYPGSIKLDRFDESDDWFKETAPQMSVAIGEEKVQLTVDEIIKTIKEGLSSF